MKIILDANSLVIGLLPQAPEETLRVPPIAFGIPAGRRSEHNPWPSGPLHPPAESPGFLKIKIRPDPRRPPGVPF